MRVCTCIVHVIVLWAITRRKSTKYENMVSVQNHIIGVAPITQFRTCVITIVTLKGDHLMW